MPDQPRTLSYVGGPHNGARPTIPAELVVARRELDGGAYVLDPDGCTYHWQATPEPDDHLAEERPAEPAATEETRPAPEQPLQQRPAPARRTRRPSSTKD